jgi:ABC-type polysaccharide/polyol phosphate export permease
MFRELPKTFFNINYLRGIVLLTQVSLMRQYRATFLGSLWTALQPAVYILILSFSFSLILRMQVKDYALYLMSGFVPWSFIIASLVDGSKTLLQNQQVLQRCQLSRSMFVVANVAVAAYNFLVAFVVMYFIVAVLILHDFNPLVFLVPIVAIPLIIFCISGAMMFSYIAPYIRDVPPLVAIVLQAFFWATPISYTIEAIPEEKRYLFELNPFYILIKPIQNVTYYKVIPSIHDLLIATAVAILSSIIAFIFYRLLRRNAIYYL